MSFVINMVMLCQVHHISTEKEGENLQIVAKSTSINTNNIYPII